MANAIETHALSKYYGDTPGIVDLTLDVRVGEVFGFLGPNGSGKSTTIRTLLNLLQPTSGSAKILGLDTVRDSLAIKRRTGYLPGDLSLYDTMTARELLGYFGQLRKTEVTGRVATLAERFDLDLDRRIRDYSTGNRQKVGLINAFMHEPELLILDEPTSGLDPLMQQEFHALVSEVRDAGATVFLSSHILSEVERIADRVGIVRKGKLVAVDSLSAFKAKAHTTVQLVFAADVDARRFRDLPSVVAVEQKHPGGAYSISFTGSFDPVLKVAAQHEVLSMSTDNGELEQAFMAYYENEGDDQ